MLGETVTRMTIDGVRRAQRGELRGRRLSNSLKPKEQGRGGQMCQGWSRLEAARHCDTLDPGMTVTPLATPPRPSSRANHLILQCEPLHRP